MDDPAALTVVELGPDQLGRAAPLFAGAAADRAYLDAVFEGRSPGRIFVDRLDRPRAALMARSYEYFVAGEPVPALRRFVAEAPAEPDVFRFFYGYVSFDDAWGAALREDAPTLEPIGRRTFVFHPADRPAVSGWRGRAPDGVDLVPLDADLARRADDELDEVIGLMWDGYDGFAEHSFGTVAVDTPTGRLLSVCAAFGRSDAEANLGVGTHPSHRRRGLATLCCQAAIERTLDLGLSPTWDCDQANPPSAALALSLGFTELAPFVELAYPLRAKPAPSTGLWRPEPGDGGATVWHRT
jgi:RimJ/RimL family protein N-acetyltransferase